VRRGAEPYRSRHRAGLRILFDARRRPGSRLGLAIVRQVAEAHGGSVGAANAPGGGAVFSLDLPAFKP
jgi:signal transduction histidine kinase